VVRDHADGRTHGLRTRAPGRRCTSMERRKTPREATGRAIRLDATGQVRGNGPHRFGDAGDPDASTARSGNRPSRRERPKGKMGAAPSSEGCGPLCETPRRPGRRRRKVMEGAAKETSCYAGRPGGITRPRIFEAASATHEAHGNVRCDTLRCVSASHVL
jgi:hypothetical protein